MKLTKCKNEGEARAAMIAAPSGTGDVIQFITKDGAFDAVRIGQLHIRGGQYGGNLEVLVESDGDKAARYRVTAKAKGFDPAVTYHEGYSEATNKRDSYGDGVEVDVSPAIDVIVDSDGHVLREVGATDDAPLF